MCPRAHSRNSQGITSLGPGVGCEQQSKMPNFQDADLCNWSRAPFSSGKVGRKMLVIDFLNAVFAYDISLGNLLLGKIN